MYCAITTFPWAIHTPRAGMNLHRLTRLCLISCSRSATTRQARCVPCGLGSRSRRIGAFRTLLRLRKPTRREFVFNNAFRELDARLKIFTSLRLELLDRLAFKRELDAIGRIRQERQLT